MEIFDRPLPGEHTHVESPDDRVNLGEVLAKFWVRKRLIFVPIIVCAGLAFVIAKLVTPTYNGDAFVMIKAHQPSGSAADPSVPGMVQIGPETVQSEVFVLQSRALASKTIERLHLDRDPEFDPLLRKPSPLSELFVPLAALFDNVGIWFHSIPGFLSSSVDAPVASSEIGAEVEADKSVAAGSPSVNIVNVFLRRLHIIMQPHSNIIQVSFTSSRPTTAAVVPNTLIELYLQQQVSEKEKALAQESERLDRVVLPTLHEKMRASELALAEYRQKSGLVRNPTVLGQELSETRAQLALARARTAEAAARLNQIQMPPRPRGQAAPATAAETPVLQRLREQEAELRGQLASLRGSLGANHPKMLQLEEHLEELKDGIRREGAGFVGHLKEELSAAQAAEAALSQREAEFTHEFAQVNGGDTQLQSLIGEADADRKTYEWYLARSNEIHSNMGNAQPDARLVSRADVPLKPSFPITTTVVITGIAIGAGTGIILAAMINTLLRGLRSKEQVEDTLGIKCLGLVPSLKQSRRNRHLSPLSQPQNAAFEQAIRSVQIKLLGLGGRDDSRVFLVAAALPGEGKSWVAASLAASLAADGFSIALVDCDLYRPSVHRMFDGPLGPGLTEYFAGSVALDEIVYNDRGSGVNYVPVGTASPTAAWRITSDRLRPLVGRLGEKYAFIILDSAPVLAVSETILLSQIAQMTIFVVKWGSTPAAIARHAVMLLLESGGAETGVLLSMVDAKRAAKYGDPVTGIYKKLEKYYIENSRA